MLKYFVYRFCTLIPKLIIVSMLTFIFLELLPGDAITRSMSPDAYVHITQEQIEAIRESRGISGNPVLRYFGWIGMIVQGDFGYSLVNGIPISRMLADRLPATLQLAAAGLLVSTVFGILFGFISAIKQNTPLDYSLTVLGMAGVSVPEFFLGMSAMLIFALNLKWFPTGGRIVYGMESFFSRIHLMVLPVTCFAVATIASLMRYTRNSMLDVLNKDYIKTARSKGISEFSINWRHGLRNAAIPVMVVLVSRIPLLITGAIVIEVVFNYPGMGNLILSAISGADMPLVMNTTMILSFVIMIASFLMDILTAALDPRVRFGK